MSSRSRRRGDDAMPNSALLASEEFLNIRKLAHEWAKEIDVLWSDLEHKIFVAWLRGDFDNADGKHGIVAKDPATKRLIKPISSKEVLSALNGLDVDETLAYWKEQQFLVISKDGALEFAKRSSLAAPSWWAGENLIPPSRSGAPGRPTSRHLVEQQAERRRESGEVLKSVSAEGEALAQWLTKSYPAHPQMTGGTIANCIRSDHARHWLRPRN